MHYLKSGVEMFSGGPYAPGPPSGRSVGTAKQTEVRMKYVPPQPRPHFLKILDPPLIILIINITSRSRTAQLIAKFGEKVLQIDYI